MKVATLHAPRNLTIEEKDLENSNLGPHDIWVKTEITGFKIGTDRGNYEGVESMPGAGVNYPRRVGDSNIGIVQAIGNEVSRVQVGDRIHTRANHVSEFIHNEFDRVVKVPPSVSLDDAVWGHLYTLSSFCYRKAFFQPGEFVAIVGLGLLGLGAVALGPLFGARVAAIGNSSIRLGMAEKMGAHATFLSDDPDLHSNLDDFTNGHGVDLVILTANPWPAYRTSCEIVRYGGRVSVVSLLGRGEEPLDFNPLYTGYFYNKGIHLIAVNGEAGYLYPGQIESGKVAPVKQPWEEWCEHLLALMSEGLLEPKKLITHRFHYSEMVKAYEMAYHRDKNMLLVTFDWRDA